jgi:NADH:ubiquinone oxidoreductase subunit B-like Fe-S oxidoreductase
LNLPLPCFFAVLFIAISCRLTKNKKKNQQNKPSSARRRKQETKDIWPLEIHYLFRWVTHMSLYCILYNITCCMS